MSLRKKTGKKPGGQTGHTGATLKQVDNPDHVQEHRPDACPHCQADLQQAETLTYTARQVFEMPEPKVQVTEHRALEVVCSCKVQADFPQGVSSPSALIVQRLTGALFNSSTPHNAMKVAYQGLEIFEEQANQALSQEAILHVDETSSRVAGTRYWFQHPSLRVGTRCSKTLPYLFCHKIEAKKPPMTC